MLSLSKIAHGTWADHPAARVIDFRFHGSWLLASFVLVIPITGAWESTGNIDIFYFKSIV